MRAFNERLRASLERGSAAPVLHCTIKCGDGTVRTWTSGFRVLFGHPTTVNEADTIAAQASAETRLFSTELKSIIFGLDGPMRDLIQDHYVKGALLVLSLGADDVAEVDFEARFVGTIDDWTTSEAGIKVDVLDASGPLLDVQVRGAWPGVHPSEVLFDIIEAAGNSPEMYDEGTFVPEADLSISHWSVVKNFHGFNQTPHRIPMPPRAGNGMFGGDRPEPLQQGEVDAPQDAKGMASELLRLLDAMLLPGARGKLALRRYDSARVVDRHWTTDDVVEVRHLSSVRNICNEFTVSFGIDGECKLIARDTTSQSNYATPDIASKAYADSLDTGWLAPRSHIYVALGALATTGDLLFVHNATPAGFCGAVWPNPAAPQPAHFKPSAADGRYVYLRIGNEIIKCDSFESDTTQSIAGQASSSGPWVRRGSGWYIIAERGALGTTIPSTNYAVGTPVYDYTIAVDVATRRVTRFSNGAPEIGVTLRELTEAEVEPDDAVTFDESFYVVHGIDGADSSTVWEVTGIDLDPIGAEPHVVAYLTRRRQTPADDTPTIEYELPPIVQTTSSAAQALTVDEAGIKQHVKSGLTLTTTSGLDAQLEPGVSYGHASRFLRESAEVLHFPASRDSYVYLDHVHGTISQRDVPLGDPEPTAFLGEMRWYKVTTDASSITAAEAIYPTKPLDGDDIQADTIPASAVAAGVTTGVAQVGIEATIRIPFDASAPGSPDDVIVWSAVAPYAFRVLGAEVLISTAIAASTVQLRDATGGGGSALSDAFDSSAQAWLRDSGAGVSYATQGVAAGGTLCVRRSDKGVGGEMIVRILKT